ncbi:MAG: sugar-binding protein [Planctomycetota bacterium]
MSINPVESTNGTNEDSIFKFAIRQIALLTMVFLYAVLATENLSAAIPQSAKDDPRFALGYLVVTHYPGVKNDGTGDSTVAIQQAIDDAFEKDMVVLFPEGTYIISDTLRCYRWLLWSIERNKRQNGLGIAIHVLVGSSQGTSRPVIKLANNAPLFDDPNHPRPMINYRMYCAEDATGAIKTMPTDPMNPPANFVDGASSLFDEEFRGIDIDCNSHAGAIGVFFRGAQRSLMTDVTVNAHNAYAGIYGLPGRNSFSGNLRVNGGKYGLIVEGSVAGATAGGIHLYNQTQAALLVGDFVPLNLVGFEIVKDQGPVIEFKPTSYATGPATLSLLDGTISVNGGTAIVNPEGKTIHIRNVYVSGTDQLIKSANYPTVSRSGTWKRIVEYAFTDQLPATAANTQKFETFTVINGVVSRVAEPITVIETTNAPPAEIVPRHIWNELPYYEGGSPDAIVITHAPYNATPNDDTDDRAAIQQAIDAASAAGHGRVFIPDGEFLIGSTLNLKSNTVMFGAAKNTAQIRNHSSWQPTTGVPYFIRTVDDANATTFLGFMELYMDGESGAFLPHGAYEHDRFGHIHWRAGRHSMTIGLESTENWHYLPTNARALALFTGFGGGRHYGLELAQTNTAHADRLCVRVDGTREPLWFYGLNMETTKRSIDYAYARTNCEINNANNVVILGIKREGASPSLIIRDSQNIVFYGSGAMRGSCFSGSGGYIQILGGSDNVEISTVMVQSGDPNTSNRELLNEDLDYASPVIIDWPNNISIYKRGEVDYDALYISVSDDEPLPPVDPINNDPNPQFNDVVKTNASPVIDGIIDSQWANALGASIQDRSGTITNATDLSATFSILWDTNHLYVLVDVMDDVIRYDGDATSWKDDGIELYIDVHNDKSATYGADDYSYRFTYGSANVIVEASQPNSVAGVLAARQATETGYTMEIAIPWSTLNATAADGALIGFDIQVNDDDDGDTRDGKLMWSDGTDNAWRNPSLFGTLTLLPGAPGDDDTDTDDDVNIIRVKSKTRSGCTADNVRHDLSGFDILLIATVLFAAGRNWIRSGSQIVPMHLISAAQFIQFFIRQRTSVLFAGQHTRIVIMTAIIITSGISQAQTIEKKWNPGHYANIQPGTYVVPAFVLNNDEWRGAAFDVLWVDVEPTKDNYDFSAIRTALDVCASRNKRLMIQFMDRDFWNTADDPNSQLPPYLQAEGLVYNVEDLNWSCARIWQQNGMDRRIALMRAFGKEFDGHPALEGVIVINETSVKNSTKPEAGFNINEYINQIKRLIDACGDAYPRTIFYIRINWLGSFDQSIERCSSLVEYGSTKGMGISWPDTLPQKDLPQDVVARRWKGKVPIAPDMEVSFINGTDITEEQLYDFAVNDLGAGIIMWSHWRQGYSRYLENTVAPVAAAHQELNASPRPQNIAIEDEEDFVRLTNPIHGDSLISGTTVAIRWTSNALSGTANLQWFNGESWNDIAVSIANEGEYLWTVPDADTEQACVRITTDSVGMDESDSPFRILPDVTDGVVLEAERARLFGCEPTSFYLGYFGEGHVTGLNEEGDTITFDFESSGGNAEMTIRYQCSDGKTIRILTNGNLVSDHFTMNGAGQGEGLWLLSDPIELDLISGVNTVEFVKTGEYQLFIDRITISESNSGSGNPLNFINPKSKTKTGCISVDRRSVDTIYSSALLLFVIAIARRSNIIDNSSRR